MKPRLALPLLYIAKFIGPLFYEKKYLTGKFFQEDDVSGWIWVLKGLWFQKLLGFNRRIPWPVTHNFFISDKDNLIFHPDSLNNFQSPGCYFQNFSAKISIAKNVYIGPNVGLITANHNYKNLSSHQNGKPIIISEDCWIGMNSIILPGVELRRNTIVGAGSVVTKSFSEGSIVIAGNPAKIVKKL